MTPPENHSSPTSADLRTWTELSPADALAVFGLDPSSEDPAPLLSMLLAEPATREFLRIKPVDTSGEKAQLQYLVAGTRIFVDETRLKEFHGDIIAGLGVWALSHSLTWSAAVALFRKGVSSIRHLGEDEVEVVRTILHLVKGDQAVPMAAIAGAYRGDLAALNRILASLARQGVVWQEGDGWRLAP
jgi:hypothetical protein